jgi:hypothetical protein
VRGGWKLMLVCVQRAHSFVRICFLSLLCSGTLSTIADLLSAIFLFPLPFFKRSFLSLPLAMAQPSNTLAVQKKSILYVGGLDEQVDEQTLAAAFRPFGDVQQVSLPKDAMTRQ